MACFYTEECGACAVTPILVTPCIPSKCCEDPPVCYPCLPRCTKPKVMYCCESRPPKPRPVCCEPEDCDECPPPPRQRCPRLPPRQCPVDPNCCPTCCRPIKTKYVIPCYRYEDGRIEQYVPTRYGRLPRTAYQRNGIQDQMHGYRGAIRYLCAGEGLQGPCVYTAVEPMHRLYPKITQEVLPVKKKKEKKCP